jgi:hypothetical protein
MSAAPWLATLAIVVTVTFIAWTWFMSRWDAREERRSREDMFH